MPLIIFRQIAFLIGIICCATTVNEVSTDWIVSSSSHYSDPPESAVSCAVKAGKVSPSIMILLPYHNQTSMQPLQRIQNKFRCVILAQVPISLILNRTNLISNSIRRATQIRYLKQSGNLRVGEILLFWMRAEVGLPMLTTFLEAPPNHTFPTNDRWTNTAFWYKSPLLKQYARRWRWVQMSLHGFERGQDMPTATFHFAVPAEHQLRKPLMTENRTATLMAWFTQHNLIDCDPWRHSSLDQHNYRFFSAEGSNSESRRFFIALPYQDCNTEEGVFSIFERADQCDYGYVNGVRNPKAFKSPVFRYAINATTRGPGVWATHAKSLAEIRIYGTVLFNGDVGGLGSRVYIDPTLV